MTTLTHTAVPDLGIRSPVDTMLDAAATAVRAKVARAIARCDYRPMLECGDFVLRDVCVTGRNPRYAFLQCGGAA